MEDAQKHAHQAKQGKEGTLPECQGMYKQCTVQYHRNIKHCGGSTNKLIEKRIFYRREHTNSTTLTKVIKHFLYYTLGALIRGVSSVGGSTCNVLLVEPLSCGRVCLKTLPLVTNHPMMVKIADGKKEAINPPT